MSTPHSIYNTIILLFIMTLSSIGCGDTTMTIFGADDVIPEQTVRNELTAIAFVRCIETGGGDQKLLEAYIFVDKQFSKTLGLNEEQRDNITYRKQDALNCRNNLLLYEVRNCDFKPFDFWNYILDKQLCKLDPVSFFQL